MTAKQAMEIFKKNGLIVTEREAKTIFDFLNIKPLLGLTFKKE